MGVGTTEIFVILLVLAVMFAFVVGVIRKLFCV